MEGEMNNTQDDGQTVHQNCLKMQKDQEANVSVDLNPLTSVAKIDTIRKAEMADQTGGCR
jgi:hypothetical protein